MSDGHDRSRPREAQSPAGESRLERRMWVVGYAVIFIVLAAGAARRLMALL